MQSVQSDDDIEYDVDGQYTAQDLANDILTVISLNEKEDKWQLVHAIYTHLAECKLIDY